MKIIIIKKNILRVILLILLIGTFSIIFGFSSQNAEESGGLSSKITRIILSKINNGEILKQEHIVKRMEKIVRKIAHFSIYTIVGILIMAFVSTYSIKELDRIAISLISGIIYAYSDEIHQIFVAGRSGQITDIILDSMGVLFGNLLMLVLLKIYRKVSTKLHKQID